MQIGSAIPRIFRREFPVAKPEDPLLTILYLLRMKDVPAVPLTTMKDGDNRALFGYSALAKLLSLRPERFTPFLKEPCENASIRLGSVRPERELKALLEVFDEKRLGVAIVQGPAPDNKRSLATLSDVLNLYHTDALRTGMLLEDVATPIFSLPGKTSIRDALRDMFARRRRRVFISGGHDYVSDRSIVDHVFSPAVLDDLAANPGNDVLARPIEGLEVAALHVDPGTTVKAAAAKLKGDRGHCMVLDSDKVITQWDLVMKPWLSGELTMP